MATNDDFAYGDHISDEMLRKIKDGFPSGDYDSDPSSYVAAVVALDEALGLTQPGDKVIIHPSIGGWLLTVGRITSPERLAELSKKMINAMTSKDIKAKLSDEEAEALGTELEQLTADWFDICFDLTDLDIQYHPAIKGKTITMRFLRESEADVEFVSATVRADGSLIQVDPTVTRKY